MGLLLDGSIESAKDQKKHFSILTPLLKKLGADVSLVGSFSSALGKKPAGRGEFDNMVVQQIGDFLAAQIVTAEKNLDDAVAALQAQDAEADAKQVVLEAY